MTFVVTLVVKLLSPLIALPTILGGIYCRSTFGWLAAIAIAVSANEIALQATQYTRQLDLLKLLVATIAAAIWLTLTLWMRRLIQRRRAA
jgi:hypothetical protein